MTMDTLASTWEQIGAATQAELAAERQAQAPDHLDHPPDAAQTGPAPGVAQAGAAAGAAGPAASPTAGTAVEMDCDMAQALWFVLCLFSAALALLGFSPAVPPLPREGFFPRSCAILHHLLDFPNVRSRLLVC